MTEQQLGDLLQRVGAAVRPDVAGLVAAGVERGRRRQRRRRAATALVAVAATAAVLVPVVPPGLPVVAAAGIAVLAGLRPRRRSS